MSIDLDVPHLKKNPTDAKGRYRRHAKLIAIDPVEASQRLAKMIDLDLHNI